MGGVGGKCHISLYYSLIGLVINFHHAESVLPMTIITEWSLPVLISTHELFIILSSPCPCPAEERNDRATLVGTRYSAMVNPLYAVLLNIWIITVLDELYFTTHLVFLRLTRKLLSFATFSSSSNSYWPQDNLIAAQNYMGALIHLLIRILSFSGKKSLKDH